MESTSRAARATLTLTRAPRPTTAYPHAPHTIGLPWVTWVRMGPRVVTCGSGTLSSGQSLVVVAVVTTDHIEQNVLYPNVGCNARARLLRCVYSDWYWSMDSLVVRGGCMASGEAICSEILTVLTSRRSYVWASRSAAVGR